MATIKDIDQILAALGPAERQLLRSRLNKFFPSETKPEPETKEASPRAEKTLAEYTSRVLARLHRHLRLRKVD